MNIRIAIEELDTFASEVAQAMMDASATVDAAVRSLELARETYKAAIERRERVFLARSALSALDYHETHQVVGS
jgi:hypothetical protein